MVWTMCLVLNHPAFRRAMVPHGVTPWVLVLVKRPGMPKRWEGDEVKKIIIMVTGLLMLFGASHASVAATGDNRSGEERIVQAELLSKQTSPTPAGKIAVYSADVETGEMAFEGFEADSGEHPMGATSDAQSSDFSAAISGPYNPPRAGNFAIWPSMTPYAAYGFSGAGAKNGSWSNRAYATTGNWTGGFNWVYGGKTYRSAVLGPSSRIDLSRPATIVRVSLQ